MATTSTEVPRPLASIFQHWRHSFEEDSGGVEVFRPDGVSLPPAFGRDGFEMRADGTFIQDDIGLADGIVRVPGRWTSLGPARIAAFFDGARPDYSFEVLDVDDSMLRLRRDPRPPHADRYRSASGMDEAQMRSYTGLPPATSFRILDFDYAGMIGKRGIEAVGASRRERFDLQPVPVASGACRDWTAFVDLQPPGPSTLRVTGTCEFPTAGFSAELRRRVPQGFNPRDLLLEKIVQEPDGPAATVVTAIDLRYEEKANAGDFDTVTILPDGPTIPVQEVR